MYSTLYNNIINPLIKIGYPTQRKITKCINLFEKSQWWNLNEIRQYQEKELRSLILHAYRTAPYYNRMFKRHNLRPDDIKNIEDLKKIPVLSKKTIRENFNDLVSKKYDENELILSATGGSTGEPMRFYIDNNWTARNMAAAYREWGWAGYNPGDKIAYLWGAPQDLSHQGELKNKMFNLINRTIILDAFDMTKKTLDEYVRMLRKFNPKVINAYVSAVYLMAQYMENRGIDDIKPKAILTSCEMLFDYQRETIERVFGCEVFDYYSGRDTTLHAGECPEHSGYHLAIENAVVEFIRDDEHVAPGEFGKIIITDLSNYAMPFIRYEIGDLGMHSDENCSCGRGLPLMKKVVGRITDLITTKEGKYVHGEFFTHLFYDTEGIKQFQFIQKTRDYSILKIIKGINYSQAELDTVIKQIYRQCGDIEIDVEFVESITLAKSGKHRFTISELKEVIN